MRDGFIQAEYLQLTGIEYINTWFKPDTNSKIIIDCQITDATFSSYTSVFGARNFNTNQFFIFTDNTTSGTEKWSARWCNTNTDYTINTSFTTRHTISLDKSTFIIDDKSTTIPGTTFTSAYTLYLGGVHNAGAFQYPSKVKIYSCKIYDNATLVRDFIPCIEDSSNNIGLYDKVNDIFYRPFGSGIPTAYVPNSINGRLNISNSIKSFKTGYANINGAYKSIKDAYIVKNNSYTKINYIESNGIQEIDTGITPSDDLVTTIDCQCLSDGITENSLFGASWATNGYMLETYKGGGGVRWHHAGAYIDGSTDALLRHTYVCSKSGFSIDGTSYSISPTGTSSSNHIYIFSTQDTDSKRGPKLTYNGRYRLYSFKMVKNNVTVRNYIPVERDSDGMIGLYETVEHKFYSSCSSSDDKISYKKRSCIKTTYSNADHVCNAMWTYNNTTNYAACAKLSMNSNGTISGNAYIADIPNSSDAIKFVKYNYDHGYTIPYPNSTSNLSLVSITVSNSSGTLLETKNASIDVPSDKINISFSVDVPSLISALEGNYTLTINVSRSSIACKFTIPITKIATIGRYFTSDDIVTYFSLSSNDFVQSGHYYTTGLDLASDLSSKYISCKNLIPIANCDESNTVKAINVITNSTNGVFGTDSGFIWYDARGAFISGIVGTLSSDKYTMTGTPPSTAKYFNININSTNAITPSTIKSNIDIYTYTKDGSVYDNLSDLVYDVTFYNDLLKISTDSKSVSVKAYVAESLVPTWTITSKVSGASYGFSLTSDGYYTSGNAGVHSSSAVCRVNFTNNTGAAYTVKFNCINYAEANYDYGIIGKINTALGTGSSADSTYTKSFKGSSSSSVQTVSLSVPTGTSWVDVKYLKDSSQSSNNDSLKFKITT